MKKVIIAALVLIVAPAIGQAAAPLAKAAAAAKAAEKAAEKRQKRIEEQWGWMLKINQDAKTLMELWMPKEASIKPQLDNLEAVEKALGSPVMRTRARSRLDGQALFAQAPPSLSSLPAATKDASKPVPVAATKPSASARLRARASLPPIQFPTRPKPVGAAGQQ